MVNGRGRGVLSINAPEGGKWHSHKNRHARYYTRPAGPVPKLLTRTLKPGAFGKAKAGARPSINGLSAVRKNTPKPLETTPPKSITRRLADLGSAARYLGPVTQPPATRAATRVDLSRRRLVVPESLRTSSAQKAQHRTLQSSIPANPVCSVPPGRPLHTTDTPGTTPAPC